MSASSYALTCALFLPLAASAAELSFPFTDLRLNLGIATPVKTTQLNGIVPSDGAPTDDDRIAGSYRISPHVGLQWMKGSMNREGVGWFCGAEVAWDLHRGQATELDGHAGTFGSDGKLSLNTWTGTLSAGPALQADLRDMGVRADTFRVEVGPTVGAGVASARVGSNASSNGYVWSLGAAMTMVTTLSDGLTLSIGGGYEYSRARVRWSNSADSSVTAAGALARLGVGYRW